MVTPATEQLGWWVRNAAEVQALSTVGLIVVTAVYAGLTLGIMRAAKRQASAANAQVDAARAQVDAATNELEHLKTAFAAEQETARRAEAHAQSTAQAAIRPWLTAVVPRYDQRLREVDRPGHIQLGIRVDGIIYGEVPLRNVGSGIAVLKSDRGRVWGHERASSELVPYSEMSTSAPVIPPGDETALTFTVALNSAAWTNLTREVFAGLDQGAPGDWAIEVAYSDWADEQLVVARILISRASANDMWSVYRIEYRDGATDEPMLSVRLR